jgi:predicted GNAT family acetyltransferase
MATDPAYRRQGATRCLLSKLTQLADDTGKEAHLVATDMARSIYEKAGFVALREVMLHPVKMGDSDVGKERFTVSL